jgi:hypothetical protein
MKTITISTADNKVINVTKDELVEIIKLEGLDKIEVSDKHGWDYLENKMVEAGFTWDDEETNEVNIHRFWPLYYSFINKETREEEFGGLVNELDNEA